MNFNRKLSFEVIRKINVLKIVKMIQTFFPEKTWNECVQWAINDMDKVSTEEEELVLVRQEQKKVKREMPSGIKERPKRRRGR